MPHTPKYITLNIKQFPTRAGGIFRGGYIDHWTSLNYTEPWYIFSFALGKKSKLSKPISLCISWDSLDFSTNGSRRLYVPRFRAHPCASVVGNHLPLKNIFPRWYIDHWRTLNYTEPWYIFSFALGKKSKLSKPISLCISWDSLDLSSAASRRLISRGYVLTTETHGTTLKRGYIYSPCPLTGRKNRSTKGR